MGTLTILQLAQYVVASVCVVRRAGKAVGVDKIEDTHKREYLGETIASAGMGLGQTTLSIADANELSASMPSPSAHICHTPHTMARLSHTVTLLEFDSAFGETKDLRRTVGCR